MNFRTDMADERIDIYKEVNNKNEIDGIVSKDVEISEKIKMTIVDIINENGAKALNKPMGRYVTIDVKKIRFLNDENREKLENCIIDNIKEILRKNIKEDDEILVVGLGNLYSTPDALGTKVVQNLELTRHIKKYLPNSIDENARSVSAIVPGVLGTTGIDSIEIIQGVVEKIKPKAIIVVDSLASKSIERIGSSIQISDTGIAPGSGVGNKRPEINKETLNIPVIAIGVPTVVELATLVSDGINIFIDNLQEKAKSNDYLNELKNEEKYDEVKEALNVGDYNMIVTPKEIDDLIDNMKDLISKGINFAV